MAFVVTSPHTITSHLIFIWILSNFVLYHHLHKNHPLFNQIRWHSTQWHACYHVRHTANAVAHCLAWRTTFHPLLLALIARIQAVRATIVDTALQVAVEVTVEPLLGIVHPAVAIDRVPYNDVHIVHDMRHLVRLHGTEDARLARHRICGQLWLIDRGIHGVWHAASRWRGCEIRHRRPAIWWRIPKSWHNMRILERRLCHRLVAGRRGRGRRLRLSTRTVPAAGNHLHVACRTAGRCPRIGVVIWVHLRSWRRPGDIVWLLCKMLCRSAGGYRRRHLN